MRDFQNLKVWQKAHRLVLLLYKITSSFPLEELYGLTSQIRRSGASIPANIAEGCGRSSTTEFAHILHIAMGSASELQYHLLLARDLQLLKSSDHQQSEQEVIEIKRMLTSLIRKLKAEC